jgi:predicted AAA+ superfamily ATPase
VVESQPPWHAHLRSRSSLRRAPKRHFVDPSLAVAALGADPAALMRDLNLLGFLFESLVVHDLRVDAQVVRAEVKHYRDSSGLEVDAIIEGADGWAHLAP